MAVADVARRDAFQMALTQNHHVIQTFPPYGADDPFRLQFRNDDCGAVATSLIATAAA